MRKKVLVRGPALTRSGYGEHTRFVLRSLRTYEDKFDIYLIAVNWGHTGWLPEDDEERVWMDEILKKTITHQQQGGQYDMSVQVTIPNEWEKLAPVNVGVTAGIETTKVPPQWVEKSMLMDRIIITSNHSKNVFENTSYHAKNNETGEEIKDFKCTTPITVVGYPVKTFDNKPKLNIKLDYKFNFLTVAQWGPRKNLNNTIKWFVEEFKDDEVGLVIKANKSKNNIIDRYNCKQELENLLREYPDRKCKVYLLHGHMTDEEMHALYKNTKLKAIVSTSHGEGYGLPLFEAAYSGMPVIAPEWSGQCDFLFAPVKSKKGKEKVKPLFSRINYTLRNVQKEAVWKGVIEEDSMWCYPEEKSCKAAMREVYKDHGRFKKQAKTLQKWILQEFKEESQYEEMASSIYGEDVTQKLEYIFASDFFPNQVLGGAELSLGSLMRGCPELNTGINCKDLNESLINAHKDATWIFGNYTQMNPELISVFEKENINYFVVEFDYKFCRYRNLELHETLEGKPCDCKDTDHGRAVNTFLKNANKVFFMSDKQMEVTLENMSDLNKDNCIRLTSIFEPEFFTVIEQLRNQHKDSKSDVWLIPGSPNWVKGAPEAEEWCKDNDLEYVKIHGKNPMETLQMLAEAKGLCSLPPGADTCPRMVIEAKLLGCELHLNDNVQHKDEEWFATDDLSVTEEYLKAVPERFWSEVIS